MPWQASSGRQATALLSMAAAVLMALLCFPSAGRSNEGPPGRSLPVAENQDLLEEDALPARDPFLPGNGGYGHLYPPSVDPPTHQSDLAAPGLSSMV